MAQLRDFRDYLEHRIATLAEVERGLTALAEKYETFFAEVTRVRESELQQLTAHTLADRGALPGWFNERLDRAEAAVRAELEATLQELRDAHRARLDEAADLRAESRQLEIEIHARNTDLDRHEELLKARNADLLDRIGQFNRRIRELGRGFGFFANLFRMRGLMRERRELEAEKADVLARIDALRVQWEHEEREHAEREQALQARWVEAETEAAGIKTKLDYLEGTGDRIVVRSTLERVLHELQQQPPEPGEGDPACPRCGTANPEQSRFCHICARRLAEDRPDFEGSIHEIAEINLHHARFSEGMQACQQIIGLVRGLLSGLRAFNESVEDMIRTQTRHHLTTLQLDVPEASVTYGEQFDALRDVVRRDLSLRPLPFARHVGQLVEQVYTEDQIKAFFETMGGELSRQAERQWG